LPSRRDRSKANATRTPLADLAPSLPDRHEAAATDPPTAEVIPDDDMLPESSATMPAPLPETDTAPANARARPGARKIADRAGVPVVPRTIAEMRSGTYSTHTVDTDASAVEEEARPEEEAPPLFISRRALLVTTLVPYAILAFVPATLDIVLRGAGFSNTVRAITNFVAVAACGIVALVLLLRNWRAAFHDAPRDLHPIAVLELWEQRASGMRRDGWVTGSLAIIAGFVVMLFLSLLLTVLTRGVTAVYAIPYLLILLFAKALGATLFIGYLQRGLFALQSPTKATLFAGLLYGVALAIWNTLTIAASSVSDPATFILSYVALSILVGIGAAWIRLRSGSLLAAVAFQLLLLLLGIAV
jgi:hypothetical protein